MGKKLVSIDRTENLIVKILGKNALTYYNHIIMKISREGLVCGCVQENMKLREFTPDVLEDMKSSDFSSEYIAELKSKYPDKFYGFALYMDNEICGYICGIRPKSNEVQYRIRKCEFFVKYVYVFEKFRGMRIASELLRQLFLNIKEDSITLAVRRNNVNAIKAYERMGGKRIANRRFIRIMSLKIPSYRV